MEADASVMAGDGAFGAVGAAAGRTRVPPSRARWLYLWGACRPSAQCPAQPHHAPCLSACRSPHPPAAEPAACAKMPRPGPAGRAGAARRAGLGSAAAVAGALAAESREPLPAGRVRPMLLAGDGARRWARARGLAAAASALEAEQARWEPRLWPEAVHFNIFCKVGACAVARQRWTERVALKTHGVAC